CRARAKWQTPRRFCTNLACSILFTSCRTAMPFDLLPRGELAAQYHLRRQVRGFCTEGERLPLQQFELRLQLGDALASCRRRHGFVRQAVNLPQQCRDHRLPLEEGDHWHYVDPIPLGTRPNDRQLFAFADASDLRLRHLAHVFLDTLPNIG